MSGFLSSQSKKKLTEVETRQKMCDDLMLTYRNAEEAATGTGLSDISGHLHEGALNIANRIGYKYADYTEAEHTLLNEIQGEIIAFMRQYKEACTQKKMNSFAKLPEDLPSTEWEKVLSNLTFASSAKSVDDIIGLYDPTFSGILFENFMGILFLKDGIRFRKNKSEPIQKMSYLDMKEVEVKTLTFTIYGRSGEKISMSTLNYIDVVELLRKIIDISNRQS